MAVLNRQKPDRMPCFTANSTITYDQMEKVGAFWPEGHEKAEAMAKQAMAAYTVLGFDVVRAPFCQTMEAEALGCPIKSGGEKGIPGMAHPEAYSLDDTPVIPDDFLSRGRIPELLKAITIMKKELGDEVLIEGGIIGPFSIAASMLGVTKTLKATVKAPDKLLPFLDVAERAGTMLAHALIDAGADIISNEDMSASPAIIMPNSYHDLVYEFQVKQFAEIKVPKILHICGDVGQTIEWEAKSGPEILSIEPATDLKKAREKVGEKPIFMGGVDTANVLFMKDVETVKAECRKSIEAGIQILAPGCAVAPGTPIENLMAMVEVAKSYTS
ncbi:MAG: MtaA/CmuA family methyltransferase [Dehalococcoidia bacterium]|nr:MAG: MtaA/CmuA family methyltransferase [Dehalococcoidia bacterium]